MKAKRLLIANRGEIAIRISQAAFELGLETITIYAKEDAQALHTRRSDETYLLEGNGVAAYLDIEQILQIATQQNCDLIHPGYGFLSENAHFAKRCAEVGLTFVGPKSEILELFGDKIKARQLAQKVGVPTIKGTTKPTTLAEATAFFQTLEKGEKMMIKALSGGGGRGMRVVQTAEELAEAYERCQSEATKAYGNAAVYVEKYIDNAHHIEVQIIGDGTGAVSHLWERDCSIQRRHQKLIEIAPCPNIAEKLRTKIIAAALQLAKAVQYNNVGTVEFLVEGLAENANFYFIETNPRIQVEHTVTEMVTGIDLVQFQLQEAMGSTLEELNLLQAQIPKTKGIAIQCRINTEQLTEQGATLVKTGQLTAFEMPQGAGIRVDAMGYVGYVNHPNFDTLLAKLIVHSSDFSKVLKKLYRALGACRIEGIETNLSFLQNIIQHIDFQNKNWQTGWLDTQLKTLLTPQNHKRYFVENATTKNALKSRVIEKIEGGIIAPMPGTVVQVEVQKGDTIQIGQTLLILEAMKMENVIAATQQGRITNILIQQGEVVQEGQPIFQIESIETEVLQQQEKQVISPDYIRPDLAELYQRKTYLLDKNRSKSVAKRHKKDKRTARENVADLCETGDFIEYGSLIVAAQRSRRKLNDLIEKTPADGIITGIGEVNGQHFEASVTKCMVLCYDYTVMAGTQGMFGHQKTDRVLAVAYKSKLPIILFAEGGGGRPGDTDTTHLMVGGLHISTFAYFAKLSGVVPVVAIVSGYCFAGNAALAGCADVIIATEDTSLGMGGPAMIEGGGLGTFHPKEVGPAAVQSQNGVIDILVKDEIEAVRVAKKYLSYFQGDLKKWTCANQQELRHLIPENRRRVYDIRQVIEGLADKDSVLELRKTYALGMITAFIRIEGKPMGLIANNPKHLGGAVDAEGSGKAARFLQLCDAHGLPVVSLCDTPGFMVGPDAEKTATVRRTARLYVVGASLRIPFFTIVLRKAYGLGAMGMAAGGMHEPFFTVSWPTGEFGGMGLEGAVRLGFKKELEAISDPEKREALYQKMVDKMYQHGKALSTASFLEIDDVIDPKDSRKWLVNGLLSNPKSQYMSNERKGFIDTW